MANAGLPGATGGQSAASTFLTMTPSTFFNILGLFLGLLLSTTCLTNLWNMTDKVPHQKPAWTKQTAIVIKSYGYSDEGRYGNRTDVKLEDGTIAQVNANLGSPGDAITVWRSGSTIRTQPAE